MIFLRILGHTLAYMLPIHPKNTLTWCLFFIAIFLVILIYTWTNYLSNNHFIEFRKKEKLDIQKNKYIEGYIDNGSSATSHNVLLPLNTNFQCSNICGPYATCSATGTQCISDIDCEGCNPYKKNSILSSGLLKYNKENKENKILPSSNSNILTSNFSTSANVISNKIINGPPPQANFGSATWKNIAATEQEYFMDYYGPIVDKLRPKYPTQYSITGAFLDDGPAAFNS